ncbi:MAG: SDR family oxidoreductase [Hyphomonadaceae bacterium]
MRVLVIGGYGLIGAAVVQALCAAGREVTGFGRNPDHGRRIAPQAGWVGGDLARFRSAADWAPVVAGFDAVVNASGALQDGARDDLRAVQTRAIAALVAACETAGVSRFVQISAPGAEADADTAFLRTKAAADEALRASSLSWTILKPGLVVGPGAYGGTALLRMLAAFPAIQPLTLAEANVQTVALEDVARAVCACLADEIPPRADYGLVEPSVRSLEEITLAVRRWAGWPRPRAVWRLPGWAGAAVARLADLAGWLGWRSPLRTTALRSLRAGVTGDDAAWRQAGGFPLKTLEQTLAAMPSTLQERIYGRAALVFPLLVLTLSAFWIASGVIGLVRLDAAADVLDGAIEPGAARALALGGGVIDIAIGAALLWRRWTRGAAWGAVLVSLGYLVAGTWITPHLWADPLGPLVKIFPAMALALAVAALNEER